MKFQYTKLPLDVRSQFFGSSILKPIIPVVLVANGKSVRYAALIDSGADFCIFDAELGEYLGLKITSGSRELFGGIQERGGSEAYLHDVELIVGGWSCRTAVAFSYDIAKWGYGMLGQKGFFDKFVIKFDMNKENIEIKQVRAI